MNPVFADAGYFLAIANPDDSLHEQATRAADKIGGRKIVTTEMVLVEFLNGMSKLGRHKREMALNALKGLWEDPDIEIVHQTHEQFEKAVRRYSERPDQRWSLTDCASFLEMEDRGLSEALAHDRDFVQARFVALMRDA